ncbi:MAG: hypothetical protein QOF60_3111 [Actinomycetota bacterium]|jgi:hypothetical protein|nr:hypothetical protein [Actinomycetota bacterium]
MERDNYEKHESEVTSPGWDAWDAAPRDGPAIFAVDAQALDEEQRLHGVWLKLQSPPDKLRQQLQELLGRTPESGTWAIIDQIGLGQAMVPETMSFTELVALCAAAGVWAAP